MFFVKARGCILFKGTSEKQLPTIEMDTILSDRRNVRSHLVLPVFVCQANRETMLENRSQSMYEFDEVEYVFVDQCSIQAERQSADGSRARLL